VSKRAQIASIPLLLAVAAACGFDGGTGGGQMPPDQRQCLVDGNNEWKDVAQAQIVRLEPRRCPYTVSAVGAALPFRFYLDILFSSQTIGGGAVYTKVFDRNRVERFDGQFAFTQNHPSDPNRIRASISGSYPAGYGSPPRDSGHFNFLTNAGVALGGILLPGNVSTSSPSVAGPNSVLVGTTGTWRAVPQRDTVSYLYQWQLDGQNITGATFPTHTGSLLTVGNHTLSVTVEQSDYSTQTANYSVSATFGASIAGWTSVRRNSQCTWSATTQGGSQPFQYSWKKNGTTIGGNSAEITTFFGSTGNLTVDVTDSYGNSTNAYLAVTVSSTGPFCISA